MNAVLISFGFSLLLLAVLAYEENVPILFQESCHANNKFNKVGNSYYIFVIKKLSWIAAAHTCRTYNTQLASLNNVDEQQELSKFLSRKYREVFWLSGNDLVVEGTFKWLGTGKDFTNLSTFDWGDYGRPSNSDSSQNCVSLKWEESGYKLNVENCATPYYYICEAGIMSYFYN